MRRSTCLVITIFLAVPAAAIACMWDYDTIKMERARFPGTLELITGKFLRHSPEFYQWRIADRLKRLEADPKNPALLDDLAVAYQKTGQHDKAMEVALKTEKLYPDRYETQANLGTFYMLGGEWDKGLKHIERALEINPNAHFGREIYQKLLSKYVIKQTGGKPLSLPLTLIENEKATTDKEFASFSSLYAFSFAGYLWPREGERFSNDDLKSAMKGILGMMKFADYNSPVLLEALGSVLTQGFEKPDDAKLLAARAYLKASYEAPEGSARAGYRKLAKSALNMQTGGPNDGNQIALETVEADFREELEEAAAWYSDLREKELSWIRDGKNPEEEFDKLYEPEVSGMDADDRGSFWTRKNKAFAIICAGVGIITTLIVVYVIGLVRRLRRPSGGIDCTEQPNAHP